MKKEKPIQGASLITQYSPIARLEIWLFTLSIAIVTISGLFLLRDWLFSSLGVYGDVFIPTPSGSKTIHLCSGGMLVVISLFHILIHLRSKDRSLLPVNTMRDLKSFLHSGMYMIGISRREERGTQGKFNGRQRIVYICLAYIMGLAMITGFLYYFGILGHSVALVHVIPGGLTFMVVLFQFLMMIRNHDAIRLKATFITGKLPMWYIRRNKPLWYEELRPARVESTKQKGISGKDELTRAVTKFTLLFDDMPNDKVIKAITEELKAKVGKDDRKLIVELANEL